MRHYSRLGLALLICASGKLLAVAPINFFAPDDAHFRVMRWEERGALNHAFNFGLNVEYGSDHNARNWEGNKRNVARIHDETQATIPMLMGQPAESAATTYLHRLDTLYRGQMNDDGILGHISLCNARFRGLDVTLHGHYRLPLSSDYGHFSLFAALPIKAYEIKGVTLSLNRRAGNPADAIVAQELASPEVLKGLLKDFNGPRIEDWQKTGIGDYMMQLCWLMPFRQDREVIKQVDIHLRAGFTAPSSGHRDEDQALSLSLGNDGAWGFPFGGSIVLNFAHKARAGLDADFLALLDECHTRRVKTELHQTEFLLLRKVRVTKDHGFIWRFNLFAEAYHLVDGLSLKAAYQYNKKDDDHLTPHCNDVNKDIINSAHSLEDKNAHSIIFSLVYDARPQRRDMWVRPHVVLFAKLPLTGKGYIDPQTFGGQFSLSF